MTDALTRCLLGVVLRLADNLGRHPVGEPTKVSRLWLRVSVNCTAVPKSLSFTDPSDASTSTFFA